MSEFKPNIGDAIINEIIKGSLMSAKCSHDEEHGCIIVWSSGAPEQLEACVKAALAEEEKSR